MKTANSIASALPRGTELYGFFGFPGPTLSRGPD
jgi:hypothetical protein